MAAKPKRLIVGNWKMYIESLEAGRALVAQLKRKEKTLAGVEIWVAPPMPFVAPISATLKGSSIRIGAQSISAAQEGAHTGEASAAMVRDAGAQFVIVGHSERRAVGESDATISAELRNVLDVGLYAILCVGELVRDEHGGQYEYVANQLRSALEDAHALSLNKLVIAYEPVWAIGKHAESAARPDVVRETVIFIRKMLVEIVGREAALRTQILYGGSVEGENATALLEEAEVTGFLVGHASADASSFIEIINACVDPNSKIQIPKRKQPLKSKKTQPKQGSKLVRNSPKSGSLSKTKKSKPKRGHM